MTQSGQTLEANQEGDMRLTGVMPCMWRLTCSQLTQVIARKTCDFQKATVIAEYQRTCSFVFRLKSRGQRRDTVEGFPARDSLPTFAVPESEIILTSAGSPPDGSVVT